MMIIPPLLQRILIPTIMDIGCTSPVAVAARTVPRVASLEVREARVDQAAEVREARVADTMTAAVGLRAPAPGMEVEARAASLVDAASLAEDAPAAAHPVGMRPPGMVDGVDMDTTKDTTDGVTMATGPPTALPGLAPPLPPPPGAARVAEAAAMAASLVDVARAAENAQAALAGRRILPAGTHLLITIGADPADGATAVGHQVVPAGHQAALPSLESLAVVEAKVARADGRYAQHPTIAPCWKSFIDLTPFHKVVIDESRFT